MPEGIAETGAPTMIKAENAAWKADQPTEIVKSIVENGFVKPGDRVLDIGCGFGRNSNYLAEQGAQVSAVNLNLEEINQAWVKAEESGVNVDYIHADATQLPLADNSFDVALDLGCSHMIPTKEDQKKAMEEAARVLKKDGILVFFGFSKDHPSSKSNPNSPMFRSLSDIEKLYGDAFEIMAHSESRWKPSEKEHAKFSEHVGINVILKRK